MKIKLLVTSLVLGACSFTPPNTPIEGNNPPTWENVSSQEGLAAYEIAWQEFFKDETLRMLINDALTNNRDLRKAALNVEMARSQYNIQQNSELPSVSTAFGANKARGGKTNYSVGVNMSNFELDFFGKVRSQTEQSLNQYLASREAHDSAILSVISATAQNYYRLRAMDKLVQISEKVVKTRAESYRLSQLQYKAGVLTEIDLLAIKSAKESAESSLASAKRNQQHALNALSLLVGHQIKALPKEKNALPHLSFAPMRVPKLASEVLLRRPDIRQAEYQLVAANANIGVARANLYPSFSLTTSLGAASTRLSDLFDNGMNWSVGSNVGMLIFNRDTLKRGVDVAETQKKLAIENYQSTIEKAFYEVADVLISQQTLKEEYDAQMRTYQSATKRLNLETVRLKAGVSTTLNLLDAQRESYASEIALVQSTLSIFNNYIDLYIKTGGGLEQIQMPKK